MAGCQEDTACSLPLSYDVAGGGRAEYTVLPDEQLLHSIRSANPGNQLDDLRVVVTSIAANDQEAALRAFRNRQEGTCDERFAIVRLLKDCDLFPQAGSIASSINWCSLKRIHYRVSAGRTNYLASITYVPGFWSVKGLKEIVWTLMMTTGYPFCSVNQKLTAWERYDSRRLG